MQGYGFDPWLGNQFYGAAKNFFLKEKKEITKAHIDNLCHKVSSEKAAVVWWRKSMAATGSGGHVETENIGQALGTVPTPGNHSTDSNDQLLYKLTWAGHYSRGACHIY